MIADTSGQPAASQGVGVLSSRAIPALIDREIVADDGIGCDQIQPASLDLRLGSEAFRLRASFLPGLESVRAKIDRLSTHRIDLSSGAVLERGCVYIVPLMERLALSPDISAHANPKSSTGRLGVFTRLITNEAREFDWVFPGYCGPLYIEITPRTFSIAVRTGSRLNQIRFKRNACGTSDGDLRRLHKDARLIKGSLVEKQPLFFRDLYTRWEMLQKKNFVGDEPLTVDLVGDGGPVGWRAKRYTDKIDLDKVGYYEPTAFWEPIAPPGNEGLILSPDEFYILASKEEVRIPPELAAEMVAYDTLVGEFRAHYAGFFDPGFGYDKAGGSGTRAVLEVRSHDVPFVIEDGQTIGRLLFEPLTEPPARLYGRGIGSSYQRQGLALAKQFKRPAPAGAAAG